MLVEVNGEQMTHPAELPYRTLGVQSSESPTSQPVPKSQPEPHDAIKRISFPPGVPFEKSLPEDMKVIRVAVEGNEFRAWVRHSGQGIDTRNFKFTSVRDDQRFPANAEYCGTYHVGYVAWHLVVQG